MKGKIANASLPLILAATCIVVSFVMCLAAAGPAWADGLPSHYDQRDKGIVTPVKQQFPFSTCWGFAAASASETSILTMLDATYEGTGIDLSERHLAWFASDTVKEGQGFDSQIGEGIVFKGQGNPLNDRGNYFTAASLLGTGVGPVDESVAPYRNDEGITVPDDSGNPKYYSREGTWDVDSSLRYTRDYQLSDVNVLPNPSGSGDMGEAYAYAPSAVDAIKQELVKGLGVSVFFRADASDPNDPQDVSSSQYISENWAHYCWGMVEVSASEPEGYKLVTATKPLINHEVTIVGWDDSYSRTNFRTEIKYDLDGDGEKETTISVPQPEGDGAWIVKNSWGAVDQEFPNKNDWGIDGSGCFYLSYYDRSVESPESYEYTQSFGHKAQDIANQHDLMPAKYLYARTLDDSDGVKSDPSWPVSEANIFTAQEAQDIGSLGANVGSGVDGITADWQIYLLNDDFADPEDGVLLADGSHSFDHAGFHRWKLDKVVHIPEGKKFSVKMTFRDAQGRYVVNYSLGVTEEGTKGGFSYTASVINRGESWLYRPTSASAGDWKDWNDTVAQYLYGAADWYKAIFHTDNASIRAYATPASDSKIEVTKEIVNPKESYAPGDVVTFKTTVANTGDYHLTNVRITDSLVDLGEGGRLMEADGDGGYLGTGVSRSCEYAYAVTEADAKVGSVTSVARAVGTRYEALGDVASAESDAVAVKVAAVSAPVAATHTVTFDSAGGSKVEAQKVKDGEAASRPDDPARDGYAFKGWSLDGKSYDFKTPVTGDITLTAVWEKASAEVDREVAPAKVQVQAAEAQTVFPVVERAAQPATSVAATTAKTADDAPTLPAITIALVSVVLLAAARLRKER